MKRLAWGLVGMAFYCFIVGCGSGSNGNGDKGEIQQVTIVDKPDVASANEWTTVIIEPQKIRWLQYFFGWSGWPSNRESPIDTADFDLLKRIISDNNLENEDVTLATGLQPSAGWGGLLITIVRGGDSRSIQIRAVKDRAYWPVGFRELAKFKDYLIIKHILTDPPPPPPGM